MKPYDYLIVGSGLFGATFAYFARKHGKKCLVIDKRPQLGGNVYCENIEGINVHKYGAHIFHTSNKKVWDFVNSIVPFNRYTNSPVANYHGKLYNLPFNMNTFYQMWGVTTPEEAKAKIEEQRAEAIARMKADGAMEPRNLEEQALTLIGKDVYEKLIKEYTEKQWGRKCTELPAFIIKRLPVRLVFDNNYFNDSYQGIPIGGYNKLIDGLLSPSPSLPCREGEGGRIDTITGLDFFAPLNPPLRGTSLYRMQSDNVDYNLLEENAKRMRKEPTEAESILWRYLRSDNLGYSFRRQHIIGDYIVDFVCLKKQLVIEVDGGYHEDIEQRIEDEARTKYLNSLGYEVLRFDNAEVIGDTKNVIKAIQAKLSQQTIYELLEQNGADFPLQGGLRGAWTLFASHLVYTGRLDEFFDYKYGALDWRTVSFKTRVEDTPNYQGNAVVNYTSHDAPYTRVIEHKHFEMFGQQVYDNPKTVISEEYSTEYKPGMEPYYPVNDKKNNELAEKYRREVAGLSPSLPTGKGLGETCPEEASILFGGRLAEYKYYDMAPIIEKVMKLFGE